MAELEQKEFQKRQIAFKISIADIINGNFVKDNFSAGYINLNELTISRVNIIGTVVYKLEHESNPVIIIDDGTGKISLRSFENNAPFSKIDVGDAALVIGRVREFNGERYIMQEILKKVNDIDWLNLRKLELKNNNYHNEITKTSEDVPSDVVDFNEEIFTLIRKLDDGNGALTEDVIKNSNKSGAENIINKLMENGDIFEIKPGKIKVLE